jgi:hypothetical protein
MRIFTALRGAVLGWRAILAGDADWERHFDLTRGGFFAAFVIYLLFAFLALLLGGGTSALNPANIVIGLTVLALYVAALAISIYLTRAVLQWRQPGLVLLVPGTYAMIAYLVLGALTALVGGPLLLAALLVAGALMFRLARVAAHWNFGISAAFAVFTCVLLVAMPMTLYMLASPQAATT